MNWGIEVVEEQDVQIDLAVSSYIPDNFIENSSQKYTKTLLYAEQKKNFKMLLMRLLIDMVDFQKNWKT